MKVYNKSTQMEEIAEKITCPRCKGFGANFNDENACTLCNGWGVVWASNSGWTRAMYKSMEESTLY